MINVVNFDNEGGRRCSLLVTSNLAFIRSLKGQSVKQQQCAFALLFLMKAEKTMIRKRASKPKKRRTFQSSNLDKARNYFFKKSRVTKSILHYQKKSTLFAYCFLNQNPTCACLLDSVRLLFWEKNPSCAIIKSCLFVKSGFFFLNFPKFFSFYANFYSFGHIKPKKHLV